MRSTMCSHSLCLSEPHCTLSGGGCHEGWPTSDGVHLGVGPVYLGLGALLPPQGAGHAHLCLQMLKRTSYSCRTFSAALFFLQVSGWGVQPNGPDPLSSWLLLSLLCHSPGLVLGPKPATGPFSSIANSHVLCEYSRCHCETLPRPTLVIESCGQPDAVVLFFFF